MVVELNGKSREIPDCWEKLSTRQYERIIREWDYSKQLVDRDFFRLFSIITETEFKDFVGKTENELSIYQCIRWTLETPFPETDVPKCLVIGSKTVDIPADVKLLSIGQNIHARQVIDKAKVLINDKGLVLDYDCYSLLTAIYLQPLYDNSEFNYQRAVELSILIGAMPITLIRPIGFFLAKSADKPGQTQRKGWLQTLISRIWK